MNFIDESVSKHNLLRFSRVTTLVGLVETLGSDDGAYWPDGAELTDGDVEGCSDGASEGSSKGCSDGISDGSSDGCSDGASDGSSNGCSDGISDGD